MVANAAQEFESLTHCHVMRVINSRMNCYRLLDIPPNQLIEFPDRVPRKRYPEGFGVTSCNPKMFFYKDIHDELLKLGDLVTLVFQQNTNADKGSIHIDMSHDGYPFWPSLNIILEGQGVMRWFSPSTPGILKISPIGVRYQAWTTIEDYGSKIDEWNQGKVALVRTDVPHNVWNLDNEARLMASTRWKTRMTWEETTEWFEKHILPLRR